MELKMGYGRDGLCVIENGDFWKSWPRDETVCMYETLTSQL